MKTDVIIIGAGIAGLTAAYELLKHNKSVALVEARNRTGGRIFTLYDNMFSQYIEGGAEFIHGKPLFTKALLREAKIPIIKVKGKTYSVQNGSLSQSDMFDEHWDVLMDKIKSLRKDMPMATFLKLHFGEDKHADLVNAITRFVEGYDAADINKVSAMSLKKEWSENDDFLQYRVQGGYARLVEYLERKVTENGGKIYLSASAKKIEWSEGNVRVVTTANEIFEADRLIVTVPVSLLTNGAIVFSPPIQEYANAAKQFGIGGAIKFTFEFTSPFWIESCDSNRTLPNLGFAFSDARIPTWWTQLPGHAPILTGWFAGPEAMRATKSDDELTFDAFDSLSYIFGCSQSYLLTHLRASRIFNWISDPWSKCAYTYATVETPAARKVLTTSVANTIFHAGEALHDGPEVGTVEAAISTAIKVVEVMSREIHA